MPDAWGRFTNIMKRQRPYWLILALGACQATAQPVAHPFTQDPFAQDSQTVRAVVELLAIGPGANGNDRKCSGTGFLVNEEGIILTNAHVVHDAERCIGAVAHSRSRGIIAKLPTEAGNSAPAVSCEVVGLDDAHDLAILKPERSIPGRAPGSPYPYLPLDVSRARGIAEGAPIWVAGHPLHSWLPVAQSGEFTRADRLRLSGPQGELVDVFILGLPLQSGSSGSPMFLKGEAGVVGVVVGQLTRQPSETIAVPIRYAVDLLDRNSVRWHPAPK